MARGLKGNGVGQGIGKGDGWGGPAKGGGGRPAKPFTRKDGGALMAPAAPIHKLAGKELRAQRTSDLEDRLYDLAMRAQREETSVQAAARLHAIYNGTPIARNINLNMDDVSSLTDDELRSELAELGGEATAAEAGSEAQRVPSQPAGVLH